MPTKRTAETVLRDKLSFSVMHLPGMGGAFLQIMLTDVDDREVLVNAGGDFELTSIAKLPSPYFDSWSEFILTFTDGHELYRIPMAGDFDFPEIAAAIMTLQKEVEAKLATDLVRVNFDVPESTEETEPWELKKAEGDDDGGDEWN